MGSEAAQAGSTFGLLGGRGQPTSLGVGLASEKACPRTLWRNLETAVCSIGRNTGPLPPTGSRDLGMGLQNSGQAANGASGGCETWCQPER